MGLEVRRFTDHSRRISLPRSLIRVMLKAMSGVFSLIVSYINPKRRGIHDMLLDTVVVFKREVGSPNN